MSSKPRSSADCNLLIIKLSDLFTCSPNLPPSCNSSESIWRPPAQTNQSFELNRLEQARSQHSGMRAPSNDKTPQKAGNIAAERMMKSATLKTSLGCRKTTVYVCLHAARQVPSEIEKTAELQEIKKPNSGKLLSGFFESWRKEWDLNPRYGITVYRISSPAHSTTLPSFHRFRVVRGAY